MQKLIKVWQLGRLSYSKSLKLQKHLVSLHHENAPQPNTLLCVEHPPVYTVGLRTKNYPDPVAKQLQDLGAEFFSTDRGGLITFHGPGQLVVYPIINLKDFKPSMRWYVGHIEKTVINLCGKMGLRAETSPHTGVWVNDKKICAIGVHGSRFVTSHGLALNCCTDLAWFEHIVPCGIEGKGVTSLSAELKRDVTVEEVLPLLLDSFSEIFQSKMANPLCCVLWFFLMIFSFFISFILSMFYVAAKLWSACCDCCAPYAELLLQGAQLPGYCARKMVKCQGC